MDTLEKKKNRELLEEQIAQMQRWIATGSTGKQQKTNLLFMQKRLKNLSK